MFPKQTTSPRNDLGLGGCGEAFTRNGDRADLAFALETEWPRCPGASSTATSRFASCAERSGLALPGALGVPRYAVLDSDGSLVYALRGHSTERDV